jgi:hypothetical protein
MVKGGSDGWMDGRTGMGCILVEGILGRGGACFYFPLFSVAIFPISLYFALCEWSVAGG